MITLSAPIAGGAAALLVLTACTPSTLPLRDFLYYYPQHAYVFTPTAATPKGVRVDAGGPLSLARVDRLFDEVEACLSRNFPGGALPPETKAATGASCNLSRFPLPLERARAAHSDQLLPIDARSVGCEVKGQTPPCYWRAMILDPVSGDFGDPATVLVVPPSMLLLKDVLIRASTGCLDPWAYPKLAECATPTTLGTDDGTGP
jgi:hypothetical protein